MPPNTDADRLGHMVAAAEEALAFAGGKTQAEMEANRPLQHLLVRNIEILGEAASRISEDLQERHPEVPWKKVVGIRNRLVHAYFDIDMGIIWQTVHHSLPELLPHLQAILKAENG